MPKSDLEILEELDAERSKFTTSDDVVLNSLIEELIKRGVYPAETIEGNPNTIFQMVEGWGPYWFTWDHAEKGTLTCPHCKKDLRDLRCGPPFLTVIGMVDRDRVRITYWQCPECGKTWKREW